MTEPVCFLIPARGDSRRIPAKNLRQIAGVPLVGWAVRAARIAAEALAGGPHAVICSTDDEAIGSAAAAWGADRPFVRPPELASDEASSVDVAVHALDVLDRAGHSFRALVLVQPTSPLLDPGDLRRAVERFDRDGAPVTSVVEAHPAMWHHTLAENGSLEASTASTGATTLLAGAFYVIAPAELRWARAFVIPERTTGLVISPETAVDIDTAADLAVARAIADGATVRRAVPVGDATLGDGPCFIIAEAGVNHDGDVAIAHRLVDAAADAEADAVKFQTFDAGRLAAADAPLAAYQVAAGERDTQRAMLARLALPDDAWPGLQDHARERGIRFLSSPFDERSADLLDRLGVPAFKVGSGELTNLPFLEYLARKGRPMLVSTGMAVMPEIDSALGAIRRAGDPPVALFHCVSAYPADAADANLAAIRTMRGAFRIPVGWSDHTRGITLPIAAVAMGADLVEKHLTLDRSRPGPDHAASLEPEVFGAMVRAIREAEGARGSGAKLPTAAERDVARVARRGLYWAADVAAGATVAAAHIIALRPATGLSPAMLDAVVGRRVRDDVRAGSPVALDDLADPPESAE
jgi:N-acetylneuraminate synthase/N,N'-diacetyllegionaminate synthase